MRNLFYLKSSISAEILIFHPDGSGCEIGLVREAVNGEQAGQGGQGEYSSARPSRRRSGWRGLTHGDAA